VFVSVVLAIVALGRRNCCVAVSEAFPLPWVVSYLPIN